MDGSQEPLVPWEAPAPPAAVEAPVGAVARLVAYLIDALFVGVLPTLPMLGAISEAFGTLEGAGLDPADPAALEAWTNQVAAAIQPYALGAAVGSVALSFVYFVGFWTSGAGATIGMRVVRFRLADAESGSPVELGQAIRRWVALGVPFTLLGVVPLAGLGQIAALVPFWQLLLLVSVASDAMRLGLHDKFARTRMERVPAGASLRIGLGCGVLLLVYAVLSVAFAFILGAMAVTAAGSI